MLVEKTKKGDRYRIAMGHGRSPSRRGLAPWSMAFGSRQQKNPTALGGGQGGLPPWAASPSGGERGSPSQFPHQLKKLGRDFKNSPFFLLIIKMEAGCVQCPAEIHKQILSNRGSSS
jgi:hypothetical protein